MKAINIYKGRKNMYAIEIANQDENVDGVTNIVEVYIKAKRCKQVVFRSDLYNDYIKSKGLKQILLSEFTSDLESNYNKINGNITQLYSKFKKLTDEKTHPEVRHFLYEARTLNARPLMTEGLVKAYKLANLIIKYSVEWDNFIIDLSDSTDLNVKMYVKYGETDSCDCYDDLNLFAERIYDYPYCLSVVQKGKYIFELDDVIDDEEDETEIEKHIGTKENVENSKNKGDN